MRDRTEHRMCIGGPLDGLMVDHKLDVLETHMPEIAHQVRIFNGGVSPLPTVLRSYVKTEYRSRPIAFRVGSLRIDGEVLVWEHNRDTVVQILMKLVAAAANIRGE